ncbi:MAG: hypothetical protein ACOYOJ_16260 [Alsobacter sp.]
MLDFVESVLDTIGDVLAKGVKMIFSSPAEDQTASAPVAQTADASDD